MENKCDLKLFRRKSFVFGLALVFLALGNPLQAQDVEKAANLFISKTFSSKLGEDPISGKIKYSKFSSGINHGDKTVMKLPVKNAVIEAKNQDYTQLIQ